MSLIRIVFLVVILIGLAGLTLQNLIPALSLVFLGMRSQPIPLGYLILAAVTAGMATGLVLLGLLRLSNHFTQRQLRSRIRELESWQSSSSWQAGTTSSTASAYSRTSYPDAKSDSYSEPVDSYRSGEENQGYYSQTNKTYEVEQHPKSRYQSGSTYSYSYRDADQSGAGRRESVVDADYREVTPAYNSADDEDDYGFDDEDFEDEDKDPRYR